MFYWIDVKRGTAAINSIQLVVFDRFSAFAVQLQVQYFRQLFD